MAQQREQEPVRRSDISIPNAYVFPYGVEVIRTLGKIVAGEPESPRAEQFGKVVKAGYAFSVEASRFIAEVLASYSQFTQYFPEEEVGAVARLALDIPFAILRDEEGINQSLLESARKLTSPEGVFGVPVDEFGKKTRAALLNLRLLTEDSDHSDLEGWKDIWDKETPEDWHFAYIGLIYSNKEEAIRQLPQFVRRVNQNHPNWVPDVAIAQLRRSFGLGEKGLEQFRQALEQDDDLRVTGTAREVSSWFLNEDRVEITSGFEKINYEISETEDAYSPSFVIYKVLQDRGFLITTRRDSDRQTHNIRMSLVAHAAILSISSEPNADLSFVDLDRASKGLINYALFSKLWVEPTKTKIFNLSNTRFQEKEDPSMTPEEFYQLVEQIVDAKLAELKKLTTEELHAAYAKALGKIHLKFPEDI